MQENSSQSKQTISGADRRRYPRVHLSMRGIFRGGVLEGKSCIIRDFCPGGFFLSWSNDSSAAEILAIKDSLPNQVFSVEFIVKYKKSADKTYLVKFEVVRVFQGGMGVSFIDPDQDILDLLVKISETARKKKQAESEQKRNSISSAEHTAIFNKSLHGQLDLETKLQNILNIFFKKLDNKLIILFKEAREETEKYEYFSAREIFNDDLNQPTIEVVKAVAAQLEDKPSLKWEKTFDEDVNGNSLALVDEKEFEAYLVLTGIISNAEADNRLLLYKVSRKLSDLFSTEFDEGLNPIGFSRLFRTIDAYLQDIQFGYVALKVAYHQMEEVLLTELILLYEELAQGVEATPERVSGRFDVGNQASSHSLNENVHAEASDPLRNSNQHHHVGTNKPGVYSESNVQPPVYQSGSGDGFPSLNGVQTTQPQMVEVAGELAQTLMALKNSAGIPEALHEVFQEQASLTATFSLASQQQQIMQFLDQIQREDNQNWENGATIADVTGRLNPLFHSAQQQVGEEAKNVLGLAGGVLSFLKEEQDLSSFARQNLQRMQTVLYKQAVSEGGLFQDKDNPLRNIINLLEQLDQRGGHHQSEIRTELDDIIGRMLALDSYNAGSLGNVSHDLGNLLEQQNNNYQERVQNVVDQCDLDQTLLQDFRKVDDQTTDLKRSQKPPPSGEYKIWQDRAKSMSRDDSVVIYEPDGSKKMLSLAWTGVDHNQFVFVDGEGKKAASMTQQELIVRLLKGTAELTDKEQKPLFDRAIISSLFDAYSDINKQIVTDQETGLISEEKYRTELNLVLENAIRDHVEHEFFYLSLWDENEDIDKEKLIHYLKHTAILAGEVFGEQSLIGRLGEYSLGLTSEFMSREGALILAETLLKSLEDNLCEWNDIKISYPLSVGVTVISDNVSDIDELIFQASSASQQAREQGDNQAWVYEEILSEDDDQTIEMERESIDWQFWLEDYSQPEEVIPLFGQRILLTGNGKGKPLLHIFPAVEDEAGVIRKPARFIKASSDHQLICEFEKQLINTSLEWMAGHKKKLSSNARCLISLSGATINEKGTLDYVIEKLTEFAVPPGKICFEIPGAHPDNQKENIERFIRTLSEFGCRFSLGQFGLDGLGQEALKLPVDYICIDEVLTSDIVESAQSYGLIKSLNDIAHMMDKQTIIPQQVSDDTLILLNEINIDYISEADDKKPECLNLIVGEKL